MKKEETLVSFRVVDGMHRQEGKVYKKGQIVKSSRNLAKAFPLKFTRVSGEALEEGAEEEDSPAATASTEEGKPGQAKPKAAKGAAKGKPVVENEDEWSKDRE